MSDSQESIPRLRAIPFFIPGWLYFPILFFGIPLLRRVEEGGLALNPMVRLAIVGLRHTSLPRRQQSPGIVLLEILVAQIARRGDVPGIVLHSGLRGVLGFRGRLVSLHVTRG